MDDQVEEVKTKVDLVGLIGERIQLKKAGKNYKGLCPFHSEKTPSFMVSPDLQIYKCFGCNESGDAFSFLEKYEGMEFPEALRFLAQKVGVKLKPFGGGQKGFKERFYEINQLANKFYSYILLNHTIGKKALDYLLTDRGLKLNTIKTFSIGYSPDRPLAMKGFIIDKHKVQASELEKSGLVYSKGSQLFDRFRGRIVFPLYDHRDNICGFSGRLTPELEGRDLAKYINTPETPIYSKSKILYGLNLTKHDIKKKGLAVITEGELDTISSWQSGIKNVVAIKGSALTQEQVKLLSRYCQNIVLALDSDVAGDSASKRGIEIADKEGMDIKVARLSGYKDPDEAARRDPEGLKRSIEKAEGIWQFLIDLVFEKYGKEKGENEAKISKEIVPILSSITDKIVQAHFIEAVARKLEIPAEAVIQELKRVGKKEDEAVPEIAVKRVTSKTRLELLEERLLSLIFQYKPEMLIKNQVRKAVKSPLYEKILNEHGKYFDKKKTFDPADFANFLPSELVKGYTDLILKNDEDVKEGESNIEKEIEIILIEINMLIIKEKLEKIAKEISEIEYQGKKEELNKLNIEFRDLTKKLTELEENKHRGIILYED